MFTREWCDCSQHILSSLSDVASASLPMYLKRLQVDYLFPAPLCRAIPVAVVFSPRVGR